MPPSAAFPAAAEAVAKKTISDLIIELQTDEYSLSVRAANAISSLDDITQDPNVPSFVRTTLWQAVSVLESIRE